MIEKKFSDKRGVSFCPFAKIQNFLKRGDIKGVVFISEDNLYTTEPTHQETFKMFTVSINQTREFREL